MLRPRTGTQRVLTRLVALATAALLLPSLTGSLATAGTYSVSTTGSDSNPGTPAQPFRTIAKGLSVMGAGDTLSIESGTYAEGIDSNAQTIPTGTSFANAPLITAASGATVTLRPGSGSEVI